MPLNNANNPSDAELAQARFAKVEQLFQAALDRPVDERAPFLNANTDDAGIRDEVLRLLARHRDDDRTLRGAVEHAAATPEATYGDRIGPYRVIRELGVGG